MQVSAEALVPLEEKHSLNGCVQGELRLETESASLLSLDRLLLEQEKQILKELQKRMRDRLEGLGEASA